MLNRGRHTNLTRVEVVQYRMTFGLGYSHAYVGILVGQPVQIRHTLQTLYDLLCERVESSCERDAILVSKGAGDCSEGVWLSMCSHSVHRVVMCDDICNKVRLKLRLLSGTFAAISEHSPLLVNNSHSYTSKNIFKILETTVNLF